MLVGFTVKFFCIYAVFLSSSISVAEYNLLKFSDVTPAFLIFLLRSSSFLLPAQDGRVEGCALISYGYTKIATSC